MPKRRTPLSWRRNRRTTSRTGQDRVPDLSREPYLACLMADWHMGDGPRPLGAVVPGPTTYAAHVRHVRPQVGDAIVVSAATGGVGPLAAALARLSGALGGGRRGESGEGARSRCTGSAIPQPWSAPTPAGKRH